MGCRSMTGLVDGSGMDPEGTEVDVSARLHRLERQFAQIQRLAQFGLRVAAGHSARLSGS